MKLWMILYTANGIGAVWGPLPYDMNECRSRQDHAMRELADAKTQTNAIRTRAIRKWRFECEWRAARPELTAR